MKIKAAFIFLLILTFKLHAEELSFDKKLNALPGVAVETLPNEEGFDATFILRVKQPLDHKDPSKGHFSQKVFLSHKDVKQPTVLITEGYSRPSNKIHELTTLLNGNQVQVEHRFFGQSIPEEMNYEYLNLTQVTADLHRIRELLGSLYENKWVSTGISKGGATTIFYRYFYPNDVEASVAIVAPINNGYEDSRINPFVDKLGSNECRTAIRNIQTRLLKNHEKIKPLFKFYSLGAEAEYTYLSLSEAIEYSVMEFPFAFWQYGHDCAEIPTEKDSLEKVTEYLVSVADITFFSDKQIEYYMPHYYQAATEMGYYGFNTRKFKDVLKYLPTDKNPHATFFNFEMTKEFDSSRLEEVTKWLAKDANKMVYIYGEVDPWSASAVPYNESVNSEWFMLCGKHHGNARISEMSPEQLSRFSRTMEKWLGIEINENMID